MPSQRSLPDLLRGMEWRMSFGERAALDGILALLRPRVSVEIGTLEGGSLESVAAHSETVHSFDLAVHPTVTPERFPNVVFHPGDSHELLPQVLAELAEEGTNVDFALVDGDHTADGVRRDVQDLLDSPSVGRTVILVHDTLNERVRAGLEQVEFGAEKVTHVELDFVVGQLWDGGRFDNDLWGGLGLVVVGWEVEPIVRPEEARQFDAVEVFSAFRRSLASGNGDDAATSYGEIRALEREAGELRRSLRLMEESLSWRVTAPLRALRSRTRR